MTIAVAQSDASTVYDQVFASPTTIKCNSDISCSILDHIRVQAVTYGGVPGTGFYTWDGVDACSPDGAFYIQPSGAAHCFVMDGFSGTGVPLSNALANTKILVGNASNVAAAVNMSGDATIANTGAVTLANSGVTAGTYTPGSVTVDAKGRVTSANSTLPSADIFVGNGSNVSAPVAVSGDATLANTGALTVSKSQGSQIVTTVASISALSALGSPSSIAHVNVQAYTAGGTSGGGVFDYSAAALTDNSCTIVPASDGKHWVRENTIQGVFLSQCDTLAHADSLASANGVPLYIDVNVPVAASLALASHVVLAGGVITPASGQTVTFDVPPVGIPVFSLDTGSGGAFALAANQRWTENYSTWWGNIDLTGATDSYAAVQAFFVSMGAYCGNGTLVPGTYLSTSASDIFFQSTNCPNATGQAPFVINAYGATLKVNAATIGLRVRNYSPTQGAVIRGLTVDLTAQSGTTATSGINLNGAQNTTCEHCTTLYDGAHVAASFAGMLVNAIDNSGTTGAYWAKLLSPTVVNTNGTTAAGTYIEVDDDSNAVVIDRAQLSGGAGYCLTIGGTVNIPNNVGYNNSACQQYSIAVNVGFPAAATYFNCGLRLWNDRFEQDVGSTTLFYAHGSSTLPPPSCLGRPSIYAAGLSFVGNGVTDFNVPAKYFVVMDGTPYIGGSSAAWNISLGTQFNLTPGVTARVPFDTAAANPGSYCDISSTKGLCTPPPGIYSISCNAAIGVTTGSTVGSTLAAIQAFKGASSVGGASFIQAQVASLSNLFLDATSTTTVSLNGTDTVECDATSNGTGARVNPSAQLSSMQLTMLHPND
jgi:hypothetical protein